MCFWKVKDGHLTILTILPLSFILARASKQSRAEFVMVCVMVTLHSKFNFEKKTKRQEMEPYTVTIVGTG